MGDVGLYASGDEKEKTGMRSNAMSIALCIELFTSHAAAQQASACRNKGFFNAILIST